MKRNILSVITGLALAIITFMIIEYINSLIHQTTVNLDQQTTEITQTAYSNQPITFWLMVILGWAIGSIICGFLIKKVSKSDKKTLPIIAAIVLTLSAVLNFFLLPHPTWFIIVGLTIFIPSTLLGHSLYKTKQNGN